MGLNPSKRDNRQRRNRSNAR